MLLVHFYLYTYNILCITYTGSTLIVCKDRINRSPVIMQNHTNKIDVNINLN